MPALRRKSRKVWSGVLMCIILVFVLPFYLLFNALLHPMLCHLDNAEPYMAHEMDIRIGATVGVLVLTLLFSRIRASNLGALRRLAPLARSPSEVQAEAESKLTRFASLK